MSELFSLHGIVLVGGLLGTFALLVCYYSTAGKRSARDVAETLLDDVDHELGESSTLAIGTERFVLTGEAGELGMYRPEALRAFHRRIALVPFMGLSIGVLVRYLLFPLSLGLGTTISCGIIGFAIGYLVSQSKKRAQAAIFASSVQFALPVSMERLVMAVQAGLDLIAAVQVLIDEEKKTPTKDPVIELLGIVMKLTESGLPFEQALNEVGTKVPLTPIRHAFTYLAVAHREGGELVMPLKELADATQSFYQETVEEEIARLPVKATAPLIVTFAGLILFFITSPLMQVISLTSHVTETLK